MSNKLQKLFSDAFSDPTMLKEFGAAVLIISVISIIVKFATQDIIIIVGLLLLGFVSYALGLAGEAKMNES